NDPTTTETSTLIISTIIATTCNRKTPTPSSITFFFFNAPPTTDIYTLSLHDALPIFPGLAGQGSRPRSGVDHVQAPPERPRPHGDRKSTRLNSSHVKISYAVFCLKKKKKKK